MRYFVLFCLFSSAKSRVSGSIKLKLLFYNNPPTNRQRSLGKLWGVVVGGGTGYYGENIYITMEKMVVLLFNLNVVAITGREVI